MDKEKLNEILKRHENWLDNKENGKRADLRRADLSGADLRGATLRGADLSYANLRGVDLHSANLHSASLSRADLSGADLRGADLSYANLRGVDLRGADLDYSCFPLWCGSLDAHMDDRQIIQLLYRTVRNALFSKNTSDEVKEILGDKKIVDLANRFYRANGCGKIETGGEENDG